MTNAIDTIFADHMARFHALRETDAGFEEICVHFEIILVEITRRFGAMDTATTDLIASFDDLRREIERRLRTPSRTQSN